MEKAPEALSRASWCWLTVRSSIIIEISRPESQKTKIDAFRIEVAKMLLEMISLFRTSKQNCPINRQSSASPHCGLLTGLGASFVFRAAQYLPQAVVSSEP
jgi:hypothetical protein